MTERHGQETLVLPLESPVVRFDLNTPEDYEYALTSFARDEWTERAIDIRT